MIASRGPLPMGWNPDGRIGDMRRGRRGLVVHVANQGAVAYGCPATPRASGAGLGITRLNGKVEQPGALVAMAQDRAPVQRLVEIAEVGRVVVFRVSPAASGMSHIDGGLHNVA
jgi:enoyl-[acyl-carrier-protein] reductase (NADH)